MEEPECHSLAFSRLGLHQPKECSHTGSIPNPVPRSTGGMFRVDLLRWKVLPAGKCCVPSPWHSMLLLQVQGNFCFLVVKYSLDSFGCHFCEALHECWEGGGSAVTAPAWTRAQSLLPAKLLTWISSLASLVFWDYRTALGGKCFLSSLLCLKTLECRLE